MDPQDQSNPEVKKPIITLGENDAAEQGAYIEKLTAPHTLEELDRLIAGATRKVLHFTVEYIPYRDSYDLAA